ncbi:type VII secretion integral membrane protein EccD [Streptomyces chumphonensis]|uniref:Type VII secretion integral membrane protein EccD n=1 Tax=Streptomyces chumphonensis TaxID=1214925 RepID=A0A927F3A7_9ACTN|nr:type VII secretion integral membrane protein EccD [Streptomyces chumphonensis]MBD3934765.1 type VII secretion integral membrane protein EccD [Streptomyces chumphonensis]
MSTAASASAPAPTASATGFCRVTIVGPDSRIDVALPEDLALADLYPEILRLSAQTPTPGAPVGYNLVRRDGAVLDSSRSLLAQRVLDGEVLSLRPFAESLPPAVFDDVSDAVASAVSRDRTLWNDRLMRLAGLVGGVVLLTLMAGVVWFADPAGHDMHGPAGVVAAVTAVLLLALAGVRARVYDDRAAGRALGLAALPHAMVAGSGVLPLMEGHGIGRLQFLLGCVAVLLASTLLIAVMPGGDAPFVATAFAGAVGTLAVFGMILFDADALRGAAVCAPFAIGIMAFLPGLSARFARLPIGYAPPRPSQEATAVTGEDPFAPADPGPVDPERVAGQVRRGHEMLLGLVGGCALVVAGAAATLGFSDDVWAQVLALVSGVALLLRARLFRYTSQIACALTAGLVAVTLLVLALALNSPLAQDGGGVRTLWLAAALAAGAALVTGIGLVVPRTGLTPFWGRSLDLFDALVLLSLTPLCLAVLDVYEAARSMTS